MPRAKPSRSPAVGASLAPRFGVAGTVAVLVLAGRRAGVDSLADATHVSHKCLLELAGEPMILRVIRALRADSRFGCITVSIDERAVLERHPKLGELFRAGEVGIHQSRPSPSASVLDFYKALPRGTQLLVTTADHALLTTEMVAWFWSRAERSGADVVAGLVSGERFRARFPDQPRTLIRFSDATYSGANLFAFRGVKAAAAAAFWVKAEKYRKKPWRLIGMFGLRNLFSLLMGRLDRRTAFERASRKLKARLHAVELPFAEAAIDVDKPADLELAARILAERAGTPSTHG
ncbi:MAG: MobA-like NTP transferase domain containing protein [Myxococcales bacterium]|jgi:GTP:adenosylcobinamide-phosphate guanylyltransferase|nr:MAG: MobA-like NTP transferase domain containing protein [Myxococcales bacterium]